MPLNPRSAFDEVNRYSAKSEVNADLLRQAQHKLGGVVLQGESYFDRISINSVEVARAAKAAGTSTSSA